MGPSDCLVKMYNKPFKIWDDSWDIHKSDSYTSSSKYGSIRHSAEDKPAGYNESKYDHEKGSAGSIYNSSKANADEENKEKKAEEEGTLSSILTGGQKAEEKQKEDDIAVKAASQVFAESKKDDNKGDAKADPEEAKKASKKSIEEAIDLAIRQEKEVIVLS